MKRCLVAPVSTALLLTAVLFAAAPAQARTGEQANQAGQAAVGRTVLSLIHVDSSGICM
jgi:hypothetical protein